MREFKNSTRRYVLIGIFLLISLAIIWGGLLAYFYVGGNTNPCSACAEKHGSAIQCTILATGEHISMFYEPNGTIYLKNVSYDIDFAG